MFFYKKNIQKNKTGITKKRKWNDAYIMYGFYRTKTKMLKPYPSVVIYFVLPLLKTVTQLQTVYKNI